MQNWRLQVAVQVLYFLSLVATMISIVHSTPAAKVAKLSGAMSKTTSMSDASNNLEACKVSMPTVSQLLGVNLTIKSCVSRASETDNNSDCMLSNNSRFL